MQCLILLDQLQYVGVQVTVLLSEMLILLRQVSVGQFPAQVSHVLGVIEEVSVGIVDDHGLTRWVRHTVLFGMLRATSEYFHFAYNNLI